MLFGRNKKNGAESKNATRPIMVSDEDAEDEKVARRVVPKATAIRFGNETDDVPAEAVQVESDSTLTKSLNALQEEYAAYRVKDRNTA